MATGRRILLHPYPGRHFPNKRVSKKYLAPSIYSYPYWRLKSNIRFYKGVFCLFGHPQTLIIKKQLSFSKKFSPVFVPKHSGQLCFILQFFHSPIKQYGIQRIQRLRLIRGCLCNNVIHFRHPNQRDQLSPYLSRRHEIGRASCRERV